MTASVHAEAYRRYRIAAAEVIASANPSLSPAQDELRRAEAIRVAHERLVRSIPVVPTVHARSWAFASLAPTTAEEIDGQRQELDRLRRMSGASTTELIAGASIRGLAALVSAPDELGPTGNAETLRTAMFDRLVQLGSATAVQVRDEEQQAALTAPWRTALLATAASTEVDAPTRSAILAVDPDGHALAFGSPISLDLAEVARLLALAKG